MGTAPLLAFTQTSPGRSACRVRRPLHATLVAPRGTTMPSRRTRRIVLASTAVVAFALIAAACGPTLAPAPPIASTPQADDVVARTNYLRSLGGTGGMGVDGNMQGHAKFAADRVAAAVGDSCQNLSGSMHSQELASWYPGVSSAENLACVPGCPPDGGQIFGLWWNSPSHNRNMMNSAYTYTGVATVCNGSVMIAVGQYRSG